MRILIDIGHPAHVHLFKNLAWKLIDKGHKVLFTCRDREHVVYLLKTYGFTYENYGTHYKTLKGKIFGLVKNEMQMLNSALRFKPDVFVSHGSTIAAHASFLLRKPHIALEDTFNMEQVRLSMPFTDVVLTGDYPHVSLGKKEINYPGYHELAYLHPNVFKPNEDVLDYLGVNKGEKYAIVRFVAWAATHDIGLKGMTLENKIKLVKQLSEQLKVFISSEGELPKELQAYQINIPAQRMHDALYYAHLFVGESATMASECACMGVPSVYMDKVGRGYTDDQEERFGLVYNYRESPSDQLALIDKSNKLAQRDVSDMYYKDKLKKLLKERIDVTSFMVWFIESYPSSVYITKKDKTIMDNYK